MEKPERSGELIEEVDRKPSAIPGENCQRQNLLVISVATGKKLLEKISGPLVRCLMRSSLSTSIDG